MPQSNTQITWQHFLYDTFSVPDLDNQVERVYEKMKRAKKKDCISYNYSKKQAGSGKK